MTDPHGTTQDCTEMELLVQAGADGELTPAEAARVAAHLQGCTACAALQTRMLSLSARLRRELPYHAASDRLREAVRGQIAAITAAAGPAPGSAPGPALGPARHVRPPVGRTRAGWWTRLPRPRLASGLASFGAGVALAASVALLVLPDLGGLSQAVVAGHIRALQPGHLLDVVSTDQHTVKPWFDGRLDYAPPVRDFRADGFPLIGGRLDYLDGRPVAVLVFQRRQHIIEVFLWPDPRCVDDPPTGGSHSGYNYLRWGRDGMVFWAVSDVGAADLAEFVRLWRVTG